MVINFYLVVAKQPCLNTEKMNLKSVKNQNHASRYIYHNLDILILLFGIVIIHVTVQCSVRRFYNGV